MGPYFTDRVSRSQIRILIVGLLWFASFHARDATAVEDGSEKSCIGIPFQITPLHNGVEMPSLQLGTAQLIESPKANSSTPRFFGMVPERTYRQVDLALKNGIRAFDTALIYRSQKNMGQVLGEWFRTGKLQREDLWITSKIFHPNSTEACFGISHMPNMADMSGQEVSIWVQREFETTLHEIGIGYIDLMLLHWPSPWPSGPQGSVAENRSRRIAAWKVLEKAYKKGWCRAIGVSNFSPTHIEQLREDGAEILPMVNQIEASITLQYRNVRDYCVSNGIVPQAYSPLGRGIPDMPKQVFDMAERYGKDVGQLAFRYLLQHGYAVTYLTNTERRMVSNSDIFDFEISAEDMGLLDEMNRPDGGWGLPSPETLP